MPQRILVQGVLAVATTAYVLSAMAPAAEMDEESLHGLEIASTFSAPVSGISVTAQGASYSALAVIDTTTGAEIRAIFGPAAPGVAEVAPSTET